MRQEGCLITVKNKSVVVINLQGMSIKPNETGDLIYDKEVESKLVNHFLEETDTEPEPEPKEGNNLKFSTLTEDVRSKKTNKKKYRKVIN